MSLRGKWNGLSSETSGLLRVSRCVIGKGALARLYEGSMCCESCERRSQVVGSTHQRLKKDQNKSPRD